LGGESLALMSEEDRVVEIVGAVLVEQSQQARGGASEVSAVDGDLL
jgi:hypothetical protein